MPEKLVPVIEDDELRALPKHWSGTDFGARRNRTIFPLFINLGLRMSEMGNLDLTDVDLEDRELIVRLGWNRSDRRLRFTRGSRTELQRYLLHRDEHAYADGPVRLRRSSHATVTRLASQECALAGSRSW